MANIYFPAVLLPTNGISFVKYSANKSRRVLAAAICIETLFSFAD